MFSIKLPEGFIVQHEAIDSLSNLIWVTAIAAFLVFLLDYAALLRDIWPVKGFTAAVSDSPWKGRFRRCDSSVELERFFNESYRTCTKKGKPFIFPSSINKWQLLLPKEVSKEWVNLPLDQCSFAGYINTEFSLHPKFEKSHAEIIQACNKEEILDKLFSLAVDEISDILPTELSSVNSKEWVLFDPYDICFNLYMQLSISSVLDPDTARAPDSVQRIKDHVLNIEAVISVKENWPKALYPLMWRLSQTCRKWRSNMDILVQQEAPEIRRQISILREGGKVSDRPSFRTMFIKRSLQNGFVPQNEEPTDSHVRSLALQTLFYIFEYWGPTHVFLYIMLTRVADNPGYQQILRDEIETSFKLTGSWKVGFLAHTPRLESFTREIFRLYSSELYTTRREVLKPVYIKSLGITLQPGTWLGTPCRAVHLDDEFYQDAATFDPERFYDPISNKVTMKATTTSNIYLPFGSGSALCPGRFIGVQTLQFILAYFIMNYELRSPKEGQKDLKNEKIEAGQLTVNTDVKIHIRKRALQS